MSTTNKRDSSRKTAAATSAAADRSARSGVRASQAARTALSSSSSEKSKRKAREAEEQKRLRRTVMSALEDMKARDVREIDVRDKSDVTDLLVIASGTSSRHVRSIAEEVIKQGKQAGMPPLGVEGETEGDWVLVDMGDIIVHVMQPRTREFYGLERLWTVGDEASVDSVAVG